MTSQLSIPFTAEKVRAKRDSKRSRIEQFFWERIGQKFESWKLHLPESQGGFGTAARSRISEINRDMESRVIIRNELAVQADGSEHSVYWSERRGVTPYLARYVEGGE